MNWGLLCVIVGRKWPHSQFLSTQWQERCRATRVLVTLLLTMDCFCLHKCVNVNAPQWVSVQISIRWWSTWRQKSLFWMDNPSNPSSSSFSGWETLFFICWSTFLTRWAQLDDIYQLSRCCQICCYDWISLQGSIVRPGFGFLRDGASLGMLREMLVMIRIWGLLKPGCLPIYTPHLTTRTACFCSSACSLNSGSAVSWTLCHALSQHVS